MKFVAYLRVSTQRQGQSGLGLEAQRSMVTSFVGTQGVITSEFIEVESGKKSDRPKLAAAITEAKRTGAKLVIAKLDRLARNVAFIATLMETGADFVCVDNPTATPFTLHIFAALAEQEARMISERTKSALKAKKVRGESLGNPSNFSDDGRLKGRQTQQEKARTAKENVQAAQLVNLLLAQGKTLRDVAAQLNSTGYRTRRGKEFTAVQVMRLSNQQVA
ncbi:recombinase family protein [Solirubrum puertoriconensis]|uniref:Resolvase/invertase-type recombinase catalytic domain-containing protein n=1 Tax=Solirubrum puertoriconensis TaxID=1751427 RepID=A0A9X0HK56_SOLP1|nr:recombinase family protein [Solirubrum puertoriconensis]KUG07438.1 hypothetical protein ASU33_13880 [Solirubrum puertoriconensis]